MTEKNVYGYNMDNSGKKNFKKFKKVIPLLFSPIIILTISFVKKHVSLYLFIGRNRSYDNFFQAFFDFLLFTLSLGHNHFFKVYQDIVLRPMKLPYTSVFLIFRILSNTLDYLVKKNAL